MRVPGGAPLAWVWGVRGRAPSHPRLPALWAGCRGPLPTGCGCGGVRAWGPATNPTARALSSRLCEMWGRHEGARGGGASCLGVGCPGSGAPPAPTACPLGGLAGCCACACPAWPGRAGRLPGRVLVRLTSPLAFLASLFACSAPSRLGLPCLWLLLGFFFVCCFPLSPPCCAPVVSCFACFPAPGALGLGVLSPPPFFFFFSFPLPPLCAPRCLLLCVFSGLGCPGPWRLVAPPPLPFFCFFCPPPYLLSLAFLAFRLPLASAPPLPFFFSCPAPFFTCCASAVCVLGCRAVCSLSCLFVVLCASSVLFLVAGVVGSWCRCLLLGVCWWLWLPGIVVWWCVSALVPVSGLAVARRPPCGVPFPCAVSCGAVLPCGAVLWCPVFFFLFFSLLVALASCRSPLVLGSGPVLGRFCFCALPVRCCAGVPAPLLSVRCSFALAGLAGVLCFCLLCLFVCCWAWLSSVVSWWVLVAPGVVSWWRAVVCPWVLCCAVLLRVVPPGVALLCAVLFRFALFGAAARCVVFCGAVPRLGVLCLLAPCFVLSLALCVFCCGVSLRGVVRRCALCRVRPGVSCCAFLVVSALCGVAVWPALPRYPASLCCASWCCAAAWCRGVLFCRLVGFVSCVGVVVPTCKTAEKFRKIFFSSFFWLSKIK